MPLTGSLGSLLLRGLLAGLLAGLLTGVVGHFVGEPKVDAAIALEESAGGHAGADPAPESGGHAHGSGDSGGHSHGDQAAVSRTGQKFGQFLASGLAGMAFGAIFGAVAHYVRRFTSLTGPRLALALSGAGWAAVVAVPFFKYPANPPGVGDPETIDGRTSLWVAAVLLGVVAVAAATLVWQALAARLVKSPVAQWESVRALASAGMFALVVTLGYVLLPGVNEVGADFPATLLWEFRISSLAVSTTLWAGLGLAFAVLTEWSVRDRVPHAAAAAID